MAHNVNANTDSSNGSLVPSTQGTGINEDTPQIVKNTDSFICMPILHEGILRFDSSASAREACSPSISFQASEAREAATSAGPSDTEKEVLAVAGIQFAKEGQNQVIVIKVRLLVKKLTTGWQSFRIAIAS